MTTLTSTPPVADWVRIADLDDDPFPILERMRRESPVHWVPAVNRYMVTRFDACHAIEIDAETFTADEDGSLMKRAMGHSMLRKDGDEHDVERRVWQPPLRPGAIKRHWQAEFVANTDRCLDRLEAAGADADLIRDFAAPLAADNLRGILGFCDTSTETMQRWSQTMIDATGNYADDPQVWTRGAASYGEVDDAIDELTHHYRTNPDATLLSAAINSDLPREAIQANMKMTIGGGLNEPRDALGVTAWALLERPDQLSTVLSDGIWGRAFDEAVRWIAPIGMYPRQTTREVNLDGVLLPKGAKLGVAVLSANRDGTVFADADAYDVHRERKSHLAFGGGEHYCAGAWVAKTSVAEIALPALFDRFPALRIDSGRPLRVSGWVFRGVNSLPVTWKL